jgi:hypothetical protein
VAHAPGRRATRDGFQVLTGARGAWPAAFAVAALALIVRLPTLRQPLVEAHGFRQTQTAYTALLFHEHGIDLLHPQIPVLGQPWALPFEFPLFQAIASFVMDLGVGPDLAMRSTGLAFFLITALLLFGFVRSHAGEIEALASLCFFAFSPFSLIWSRTSLMEYMATAGAIAWCWAALSYRRDRGWVFLASAVAAGSVACLVKITSAAFWVAPILLAPAVRSDAARGLRAWVRARVDVGLAAIVVVPLAVTAVWVRYSDHVKAENLQGRHLTSSALETWNYGTLAQRLDQGSYLNILDRIDPNITGGVIWGGLMLVALALASRRALWIGIAITIVAPIATFFNLYTVHEYYLCAVTPAIAMLLGVGLVSLARAWGASDKTLPIATAAALALWAATTLWLTHPYWSLAYSHISAANNETLATATGLAENSAPNDLVVMDGYDWSPEILYYARRRGTMLRWPEPAVLRSVAPTYRVMVTADPIHGYLQVLREFYWIEPVGSNILRMSTTRRGLPPADVQATTTAAPAHGRPLLGQRSLSCASGSSLTIPGGRGTAWISVAGGLPDTARIVVGAGLAALPAVAAIALPPRSADHLRGPESLTCTGVSSIDVTGVSVVG